MLQIKRGGPMEMTSVWHPLQIYFPLFCNLFSFPTTPHHHHHKTFIIISWPIWTMPNGSSWVWPMRSPGGGL